MTDKHDGIRNEVERMKSQIEQQRTLQGLRIQRDARVIRQAAEASRLLAPRDVHRLASNLHRIIEECSAAGREAVRDIKAAITREAGMMASNGRSGRLHEHTLPPGLDAGERGKRARRLAKRPGGYFRLADAAAKLSGRDPDGTALRLAEGTTLADRLATLPEAVEPDHLDMLVDAIRGEGRRISGALSLDWYFTTIDEHCLVRHGEGWAVRWEEPDLEASIPVAWLQSEEKASFEALWHARLPGGGIAAPVPHTGLVCERIGLCLAPFGHGRQVVPCLVRRHVTILVGHRHSSEAARASGGFRFDVTPPLVLPPPAWLMSRLPVRAGVLEIVDKQAVGRIVAGFGDGFHRDEYEEVTPAGLLRRLEGVRNLVARVPGDRLNYLVQAFTRSTPGSRLGCLEIALLHGSGDEMVGMPIEKLGATLERLLAQSVESLRRWTYEQGAQVDEGLSKLASATRHQD